jgi:acetylornithine deacetylase
MKAADRTPSKAIELLQFLVATPSFSREEEHTAQIIENFLTTDGVIVKRQGNNIWCLNKHFDKAKPTILLNSHHDTVKPNSDYTRDPYSATIEEGKLFGLGSNDAGAALVSMILSFLHFYGHNDLRYNLVLACTAEEEISGVNGIMSIIDNLPHIDMAIVGEPTSLRLAIAEKGLMVLDCTARGKSGHAARNEGENAILMAMQDINWFSNFVFEQESAMLGPVKMTTTMIEAGTQHNVVPDICRFVVDVRTTDAHSNQETLEIIQNQVLSEVKARSTRLKPSGISTDHPLVKAGLALGLTTYGSPTLSDQALISAPSIKLGPGDSARSHSADEFIYIEEIAAGIETYIKLLTNILTD